MIILKSKKTNKIVVASDNPNVIRDYIVNRYNKAFDEFKYNLVLKPSQIDGFISSVNDLEQGIATFKPRVVIWYNIYEQFLNVCPASHRQKSVDFAETEEYTIRKVEIDF